jgi:hypothetical protein
MSLAVLSARPLRRDCQKLRLIVLALAVLVAFLGLAAPLSARLCTTNTCTITVTGTGGAGATVSDDDNLSLPIAGDTNPISGGPIHFAPTVEGIPFPTPITVSGAPSASTVAFGGL